MRGNGAPRAPRPRPKERTGKRIARPIAASRRGDVQIFQRRPAKGDAGHTRGRQRNALDLGPVRRIADRIGVLGPTRATTNLWGERWAKLIVNSMSNPIAGITGLGSADLRARPEVLSIFIRVACEALRLTEALGVNVEAIGRIPAAAYLEAGRGIGLQALHAKLIEGSRNLGAGRPSLLQDVLKGRRTEVQYLNGYMVRKGKELGIPTPMNEAIVRAVEAVESGALKPDPGNLEILELTSAAARPVG